MPKETKTIREQIKFLEIKEIINALLSCHFNKGEAAKLLNIDRKTLYNRIDDLGIDLNKITLEEASKLYS